MTGGQAREIAGRQGDEGQERSQGHHLQDRPDLLGHPVVHAVAVDVIETMGAHEEDPGTHAEDRQRKVVQRGALAARRREAFVGEHRGGGSGQREHVGAEQQAAQQEAAPVAR